MPAKLCLIWNPAAGRATPEKLENASKYLSDRGFEVSASLTGKRGDGAKIAREALDKGSDLIVACGGDGTINEIIQPMISGQAKLGVIPLGTVNVLAKELGIPNSFTKALERSINGKERKVSLGKATIIEENRSRFFFLMAGVGFDAEVAFKNSDRLKKMIGRYSYLLTAAQALLNYRPQKLRFFADGEETAGFHSIIGKASRYGGNFKVTGSASLFDPDLHMVILRSPKRSRILRLAWSGLTGTPPYFEGAEFRITKRVEISGKAGIQLDGEYIGQTPCVIESVENCLAVMI